VKQDSSAELHIFLRTRTGLTDDNVGDGSVVEILSVTLAHGTSGDVLTNRSELVVSIVAFPSSRDFFVGVVVGRRSDRLGFRDRGGRRDRGDDRRIELSRGLVLIVSSGDAKGSNGGFEEILVRSGRHLVVN